MTIVNNFKFIYGKPTSEKSQCLVTYKEILGFTVYKVSINELAYVVFDEENSLYYNFERTKNADNANIDRDLRINIRTYITKNIF